MSDQLPDDLKRIADEHMQDKAAIEAERSDPDLRMAMIPLVANLRGLIEEAAQELAEWKEDTDAFHFDQYTSLVIWQLVEFLTQSAHEFEARGMLVSAHQLTPFYAANHFRISVSPETYFAE